MTHPQAPPPHENWLPGDFTPDHPKPVMAMVEITRRCNLACPVCFADTGSAAGDPSLSEVGGYLRNLLAVTGMPIPIQISGGEPTLREDLPDIIALAGKMGFSHIDLVTNGVRIAAAARQGRAGHRQKPL